MAIQSISDTFRGTGLEINQTGNLLELRLAGLDGLVGIIDEKEKVFYLPSGDQMGHRLKGLPYVCANQVWQLYLKVGEELDKNGYNRRHIVDF